MKNFQNNNRAIVTDFDTADNFTTHVLQMTDVKEAKYKIRKIIEHLEEDPTLGKELKVGILEKIKFDLSMDFPFVRRLSEDTVKKLIGEDLYAEGNEAKLGIILLDSQQECLLCLDIILEAAHLLNRYDKKLFESRIVPFMKNHGLEEYIEYM
ncbi:hypothetical protein PIROE2DRAFT_63214 [Piromyces sp. E2]|nr:hypothetical protein PIROE2DRAFT_63214 [Piromyces sp. E2]|eukprot:OUM60315.1 hypothetical protein PIROE2DRAFT_63214 [Piromyces sp. E2]